MSECKSCRFWGSTHRKRLDDPERTVGFCFRFPPTINFDAFDDHEAAYYTARPVVDDDDWCGEWEQA